jgi:multisubunit Na+/H+ antiporter MnhE subunit
MKAFRLALFVTVTIYLFWLLLVGAGILKPSETILGIGTGLSIVLLLNSLSHLIKGK